MKWKRLSAFIIRIRDDRRWRNISMYAASGTYYLFLSLGPLLVLVLSIVPYTPLTEQELLDALLSYMPDAFQQLVYTMVSEVYRGSVTVLSVSLAAELWSAGKFLSGIMRGVGEIYEGTYDGFFKRRLVGALYTIALLLFILANQILILFGERYFTAMQERAPALSWLWNTLLHGRGILVFSLLTLVIALLFRYVPRRKQRFWRQLPGAAIAALLWLVFSKLYTLCVEYFALFSIYGSLAIISISLFWIYFSLYFLFLGAWINTLGKQAERGIML